MNATERPFSEFREEMRYEYELTPDSVVIDCGGYEGRFAEEISRRYGCWVYVHEPVREFYERTRDRLAPWGRVAVIHSGVGRQSEFSSFRVKGDMTGEFADGTGSVERVDLEDAARVIPINLSGVERPSVDLMKLNIEGGEFDVIERLLECGLMPKIRNLQVQWHPVVADAEQRREAIMKRLAETHELTWDFGWVWQNWRVKAA